VQAGALDLVYLRHWAGELSLAELFEAALRGERPPAPGNDPRQQGMF
jgi:hypothetical protein